MLWDVDPYSLLAALILLLVGVSISVMVFVIIRRILDQRNVRLLELESRWYESTVVSIFEGKFWGDPHQLRKTPNSVEWKAIETLLLKGMASRSKEQRQRSIQMFGLLGYVEFYIRELRTHVPWRRIRACYHLGQMKNPRAVSSLIQALDDCDWGVRQKAVWALGRISDAKAIRALVELIRKASGIRQRISTQVLKESLIAHGEMAVPLLVQKLLDPGDAVRILVAEILAEIPSKFAIGSLTKSLNDTNPEVRAKAAYALGRTGHPLAVKPLIVLLSDPFWYVRLQAARSLGKLRSPRAISGLCSCLGDSHWQVRMAAAHSLVAIGPLAIQALTTHLLYMADRYACEQMAETLQQSGLVDQWIEDLGSPDEGTVQEAKNILSAIARNWLLDPLLTGARSHPKEEVRMGLIEVLGGVINPKTSKILRQISLYDSDFRVRERAQNLLIKRLRNKGRLNSAGSVSNRPSVV